MCSLHLEITPGRPIDIVQTLDVYIPDVTVKIQLDHQRVVQ